MQNLQIIYTSAAFECKDKHYLHIRRIMVTKFYLISQCFT
nr:MAG TPA: hypothetical protein [Microviridae sp.]